MRFSPYATEGQVWEEQYLTKVQIYNISLPSPQGERIPFSVGFHHFGQPFFFANTINWVYPCIVLLLIEIVLFLF